MNSKQKLLLIAAILLLPVALSYGVKPQFSMGFLFDITVEDINTTHVFRAIMGIYLLQAAFWMAGAFVTKLTDAALYGLIVFMLGVGLGRALSIGVDGNPHWLMVCYLTVEIVFVIVGTFLLCMPERNPAVEQPVKEAEKDEEEGPATFD